MSSVRGRVAVAMSGGVDSSTAAALLKEEGYEVIGLTMHLWNQPPPCEGGAEMIGRCCSPEDIQDARRVADQIGIPHYVINLRRAFEEEVVNYFVEEYLQGRTPNPCIRCNDQIKFVPLLRQARALGAQALATGHYARIEWDPSRERHILRRGMDTRKDQSYFLFTLNQEQMGRVIFPLGEKSKAQVRRHAARLGLRVAFKKESQEICFIPDNDYREFLETRKGKEISRPGEIVNRQGQVLGRHQGLYCYTIGQRRGLGLGGPHPHYVLALDPEKNQIVAGGREDLLTGGLIVGQVNWISFPFLEEEMEARVQIRYRHPGAPAFLSPLGDDRVKIAWKDPQGAVTPGQAAVFYRGDEVVGGGWIEKSL